MSKETLAAIVIIFSAAASTATTVYHSVEIANLNVRYAALEKVFVRQHGEIEKAVRDSVDVKYKAYANGVHACQSMCYGRMKSYEMNEKEANCVCFSGFAEEN